MKISKGLFTSALIVMTLLVTSCGKNNESGRSGNRFYGSSYSGVSPANTNNPHVQQVFSLMPCSTGFVGNGSINANQRIGTGVQMNFRVAANSTYIGVTPEGDISVLTGDQAGNAVMSLYICPRPLGGSGSASMPHNPVFNRAIYGCRIDEITSATVYVPSSMGQPYVLAFAPIYFNRQLRSSLCTF